MKKANVIREPGLTIDVRGATVISDGVRLSAMPAVTEVSHTLAGSVRGAKPDISGALPDVVSKTARPGQPRSRVVRQVLNEARRG